MPEVFAQDQVNITSKLLSHVQVWFLLIFLAMLQGTHVFADYTTSGLSIRVQMLMFWVFMSSFN